MLRQQVSALQESQAENLSGEEFQRQLAGIKARDVEEINRLRSQVSELRERTNELINLSREHAKALIAIERERWERQYRHLQAEYTGKPRVPKVGAWLGVTIGNVDENDRAVNPVDGTLVRMVVEHGPAASAGIKKEI